MDNGKCILRVHKKIVLAFFVLSCGMLLTGCEMVNILAYKAAEKVANGEMFAKADCTVLSVEGSIGSSHYICENSTDTYVYDKENICNYNTGEMLVELDHDLLYMACNDDVLYYATDRYDESFYCYNFQTGEKQLVQDGYEVTGMQAYEDDVFVVLRELDTQSDYSEDYKEIIFRKRSYQEKPSLQGLQKLWNVVKCVGNYIICNTYAAGMQQIFNDMYRTFSEQSGNVLFC
ncbi:MAG: hypothetical protein MR029_07295 [Clostridium sp.]|nr:hypothetical protein [Clostridium sp.]